MTPGGWATPGVLAFGRSGQRTRSIRQPQLCSEFETRLDFMRPVKPFKRYIRMIGDSTENHTVKASLHLPPTVKPGRDADGHEAKECCSATENWTAPCTEHSGGGHAEWEGCPWGALARSPDAGAAREPWLECVFQSCCFLWLFFLPPPWCAKKRTVMMWDGWPQYVTLLPRWSEHVLLAFWYVDS